MTTLGVVGFVMNSKIKNNDVVPPINDDAIIDEDNEDDLYSDFSCFEDVNSVSYDSYYNDVCKNGCEDFDLTEALKIAKKYGGLTNLEDDGKDLITAANIDDKRIIMNVCEYFDPEIYYPMCEESYVVKYSDFLAKKRELFGNNEALFKRDIFYNHNDNYQYVSEINSFVLVGTDSVALVNSINVSKAFKSGDKLYVFAYYSDSCCMECDLVHSQIIQIFELQNNRYILTDAKYAGYKHIDN